MPVIPTCCLLQSVFAGTEIDPSKNKELPHKGVTMHEAGPPHRMVNDADVLFAAPLPVAFAHQTIAV